MHRSKTGNKGERGMKADHGISFANVEITSGFWHHRQRLNRDVTIYTVMQRFADTGRFAALNCQWREGEPNKPHIFWDSDVAKWMESVGYLIRKGPAPDLEAAVEKLIDSIEAQQCADGYFNSYFTTMEPGKRWTERAWHELYCAGHLIEAAIAWKNATGRDRFLQIMTVLDNLYISAYNHSISVQKGDDHYDKRNFDAHNVIQRKDRPEVIPLFSVSEPLYIACRGSFYVQTTK